ncbi:MAG: iron ABC transporter permease, partial [Spirochaetia bacterium]|nr:iron ABC transporter permease [Spirochaetia bacterium]
MTDQVPSLSKIPLNMKARKLFRKLNSAEGIISIIVIITLIYFVVLPVIFIIYESLSIGPDDLRRYPEAYEGDLTFQHWTRTFTSWPRFFGPLTNTIIIGTGATILITILGMFLSWLVALTNIKYKKIIGFLCILPYLMPSWAFAMAWLAVFQHRGVGRPTGFLAYFTGLEVPEWLIFGPVPIILVSTIHYFPFLYLMVKASLENIDNQLEESAEQLGASRFHILRKITLPLVTPAIFSAAILVFSRVLGTFATPAMLGIPARFSVLSTQIYSLTRFGRMSEAFSVALSLILFCAFIIYINNKLIGTRKSFVTIAGKSGKYNLFSFGRYRKLIGTIVVASLLLVVVVPLLLLAYSSLLLNEGDWSLSNMSLHWWLGQGNPDYAEGEKGIFVNPAIWRGAYNTMRVAVSAGLLCGFFGLFIGYSVVRMRGTKIANIIDSLAFIPIVIPSIAFGAVYLSIYAVPRPFVPMLYGSFLLLVFVSFAKRIPYTARTGVSAMHQIGLELEEAAILQGASLFLRFRKIIYPLARPGIIAGILLVMTTTVRELSLFILLMTPGNRVLTAQTLTYSEIGAGQ